MISTPNWNITITLMSSNSSTKEPGEMEIRFDRQLAYGILRLTLGVNILLHGLVRLPHLASSADSLVQAFAKTPLPPQAVDVIISNCVINLSADKARVLKEAHRVLRPGGRFAVSDVICRGEIPDVVRQSMELWVGCVAGALAEGEYRRLLQEAGFVDIDIEPTRVYEFKDAGIDDVLAREVTGRVMGAFIRARKP